MPQNPIDFTPDEDEIDFEPDHNPEDDLPSIDKAVIGTKRFLSNFGEQHPKLKEIANGLFNPPSEVDGHPIVGPGLMSIPGADKLAEKVKNAGINSGSWWGGFGGDLLSQIIEMGGTGFDPRTAGIKSINPELLAKNPPNLPRKPLVDISNIDLNATDAGLNKIKELNHIQKDVVPYAPEEPVKLDRFSVEDQRSKEVYPYNVVPRSLHPDESNFFTRNVPQSIQDKTGQFGAELKPTETTRTIESQKRVLDPQMAKELYERIKDTGVTEQEVKQVVPEIVQKAAESEPKFTTISVNNPGPEAIAKLTKQGYKIANVADDGTVTFNIKNKAPKASKLKKIANDLVNETSGEASFDPKDYRDRYELLMFEHGDKAHEMMDHYMKFVDTIAHNWKQKLLGHLNDTEPVSSSAGSSFTDWWNSFKDKIPATAAEQPTVSKELFDYYMDTYGPKEALTKIREDHADGNLLSFLPENIRQSIFEKDAGMGFKYGEQKPIIQPEGKFERTGTPRYDMMGNYSGEVSFIPDEVPHGGLVDKLKELITSEEGSLDIDKVKKTILAGLAKPGKISLDGLYNSVADLGVSRNKFNKIVDDMLTSGEVAKAGAATQAGNVLVNKSVIAGTPQNAMSSIDTLADAIRNAVPIRQEQEQMYSVERAQRIQDAMKVKARGEKGYFKQLKKLEGPYEHADFEPIRQAFSQLDIDGMMNMIQDNPGLRDWEKIRTKVALSKLLTGHGGIIPQQNEIQLLERTFGPKLTDSIEYLNGAIGGVPGQSFAKTLGVVNEVANFTKTIQASVDLSAPLRQGLPLIYRGEYWGAFRDMFKYAGSEKAYDNLMQTISTRKYAGIGTEAGLKLTTIGTDLAQREEAFLSKVAEKYVPGVRASERAYVGFLDKLRADTFDNMLDKALKAGYKAEDVARPIARFVNGATGRGSLGSAEKYAAELNTVFFSPRLISSRIQLLTDGFRPDVYMAMPKGQRLESLKALFALAGVGSTISTLVALGMGGKIQFNNPTSSDFAKARVGSRTRLDTYAGVQQYLVELGKQVYGGSTSTISGRFTPFGSNPMAPTRWGELENFGANKLSPMASLAYGILNQKRGAGGVNVSTGGRPWDTGDEMVKRVIPLMIQDIYDLATKEPDLTGLQKMILGTAGAFGSGVQVYDERPSQQGTMGRKLNPLVGQGLNPGIQ